ncbi:hypothetical protein [Chryseobacterium sp. MDT2-18]|uniref:hypothetical protein n=1 Tax=Chryseobacterium sp. MDT2-18 TaxID=1259136 RepID=UPI00278B7E3C|nr:hypothetical protein [Chryseobacterium sp. MDT2-18]MDQ0477250.1 hypothetical protein [Chryseobacterium sp. MDT2-18]
MKKHKAARFLMTSTVLFVQVVFLLMIIKEQYETNHFATIISVLFITLMLISGYKYLDLHHEEYVYENISVAIWVPVGASACYLLNTSTDLGSVLSVGITGAFASFFPSIDKKSEYFNNVPAAIYCGAFIGMSALKIAPSIGFVIAAGILAGLFLMLAKNLFVGIGGKLGSIAFGSMVIVTLIHWLL